MAEEPKTQDAQRAWKRLAECFTGPWTMRNLFGWVVVIALIFIIKGCLVDQYTIPSGSMEPTLQGDPRFFRGDRVLVNKWVYGPRIPFTTRRLWQWNEPERWDIVVFRSPDPEAEHPILIKRVVALSGEQVNIRNGTIWIDGNEVEPPEHLRDVLHYVTELEFSIPDRKRQFLRLAQANEPLNILNSEHPPVVALYEHMDRMHPLVRDMDIELLTDAEVETLCADLEWSVINLLGNIYKFIQPDMFYGIREEEQFSRVPEHHAFMLGDNSEQSLDGRMYGWVPYDHLYGRTFAVWWPWSHRQDFTDFSATWWGKLLLYGIPALIIAAELYGVYRRRKSRN